MARKNRTYDKEFDVLQKYKHENQALKRENARLKKELDRIDISKYEHLAELVAQQSFEDIQVEKKSKKQKLLDKWECYECKEGHMRIHILQRPDGLFYYRKCSICRNKTKLQKYDESVEGIKDEK